MSTPPLQAIPLRPITASYALTFDEYRIGFGAFTRKTMLRTYLIQLVFVSGVVTWGQWYTAGFFLRSWYGWTVFALAFAGLLMIPFRFRRVFRAAYKSRFGGEQTRVQFANDGVRFETPTVATAIRWNGLTHYEVKKTVLILYRTARVPFVIPRRAFESAGDFDEARRWCEEAIGYASEQRGFAVETR